MSVALVVCLMMASVLVIRTPIMTMPMMLIMTTAITLLLLIKIIVLMMAMTMTAETIGRFSD